MGKIREREQDWSFEIADYILEHYRKKKLFYDINHPTNNLLQEISIRIIKQLGIEADNLYSDEMLDSVEDFVYQCVKDVLKIEWEEKYVRANGRKMTDKMDYREYVREYLYWHCDIERKC